MIGRRAGLFWFTVGLAMAAAPGASADAPAAAATAPASLLLVVRAPSEEEAPLIDVIRDAARRRNLDVTFDARVAAVLRVEIDVASAIPSVSVVDLRDDVVLTRRTLPRTGSSEVLREELALVVASAIDAARVRVPAPRTPPPQPPPRVVPAAPQPDEPSASSTAWRGEVVAELRTPRNDAPLVPALGLGLRASFDSAFLRPSIGVLAAWRSPSGVDGDAVDLRTTGESVRLLAGATFVDTAKLDVGARLGPGLTIERIGARSRSPDVAARAPTSVTTPTATGLVDVAWKLGVGQALTLGVGADVPLARKRAVLATPAGAEVLSTPARIQPFVQLSVVLTLGGGP